MRMLWQDLRYAARMLRKAPGFTVVAVFTLALGIGANTAMFSVIDAVLLNPLRYPEPNRLAILWQRSPGIDVPQDWLSPKLYDDIKTQNRVFDKTAIVIGRSVNLTGLAKPQRIEAMSASPGLLDMLGAKPLFGRTFLPEEDRPGKPKVAVLSYGLWMRLFGADPQILGRSLLLNGTHFTVAGVLRPEFALGHEEIPTIGGIKQAEIFLTLPDKGYDSTNHEDEDYNILARVKPDVSMTEAQADISVIANRIRERDGRHQSFTISVVPLLDQVVGSVRRAALVLAGAVALVLLIACANVANLLLARTARRQTEIAIRTAMGAGWGRLVRQFLTESILLGVLGGATGLLFAEAGLYIMRRIHPGDIPRLAEIGVNPEVLAFTFGISLLTGIVFGVVPAMRVAGVDLNSTLKAGGRGSLGGGLSLRRDKLRAFVVAGELAFSLVLLTGAGLFLRSFANLLRVPMGFNPDHTISMRLTLTGPKYAEPAAARRFHDELSEQIASLPGVTAQAAVSALPLAGSAWGSIEVEGYTPPPNEREQQIDQRIATPDYFRAMQIRLIKGRVFSESDTANTQPVAVIDEKMAAHFWPGGDALGKRIRNPNDPDFPWSTIVGVVQFVKQYGAESDRGMAAYYAEKQEGGGALFGASMYVVARTSSDPATAASAIEHKVHAIDPDVPVYDVATMDARLHDSFARQRFSMAMLGGFAVVALALAAVGVFGVMSYVVSQGTRDIAIRLALGAQPSSVLALIVKQGMTLACTGIASGLLGSLMLSRVIQDLLYGVRATDPLTLTEVSLVLLVATLAACYVPTRRAMRVNPAVALRGE